MHKKKNRRLKAQKRLYYFPSFVKKKKLDLCFAFPSDFCVYIYLAIRLRLIRLALNMSFLCRYSTFQVIFFLLEKTLLPRKILILFFHSLCQQASASHFERPKTDLQLNKRSDSNVTNSWIFVQGKIFFVHFAQKKMSGKGGCIHSTQRKKKIIHLVNAISIRPDEFIKSYTLSNGTGKSC